jgi:hypothetical protein
VYELGPSNPCKVTLFSNVTGGSNVNDVVHICGSNNGSHSACPASNVVSDLTLTGITSSANNTIQDDVADTLLSESTDPTVGMYILGEPVTLVSGGSGLTGYSRFTTSPSIPTWRVGTADPPTGNCDDGPTITVPDQNHAGTGSYRLCEDCNKLNAHGR